MGFWTDIFKDTEKDAAKDIAKDAGKSAARDAAASFARDAAKDIAKDAAKDSVRDGAKDTARDAIRDAAKDSVRDAARDAAKDATKDAKKDIAKYLTKDGSKDIAKKIVKLAAITGVGYLAYKSFNKFYAKNNKSFNIKKIEKYKDDLILVTFENSNQDAQLTGGETLEISNTDSDPIIDNSYTVKNQYKYKLPMNQVVIGMNREIIKNGTTGVMKVHTTFDNEFLKTTGKDVGNLLNSGGSVLCETLGICDIGENIILFIKTFAIIILVIIFLYILYTLFKILKH